MRSLLIFLLGIIVGVGGMLFLPELTSRREQLSEETKKHLEVLEGQVRDSANLLRRSAVGISGIHAGEDVNLLLRDKGRLPPNICVLQSDTAYSFSTDL